MKKSITSVITMIITLAMVINVIPFSVFAADNDVKYTYEDLSESPEVDINVTGTYDYKMAFEFVDILNEKRKEAGLSLLIMNKGYMDCTTRRAAEISMYYSHQGPNGKYNYFSAEIITTRRSSAQGAFDDWYASPGHRNIMFMKYSNQIGVGCFVGKNGIRYWAVNIGYARNPHDIVTPSDYPDQITETRTLKVGKLLLTNKVLSVEGLALGDFRIVGIYNREGSDKQFHKSLTEIYKKETEIKMRSDTGGDLIDSSNFTYTTDNPDVIEILGEDTGKYQIVGAGKARIIATLKSDPSVKIYSSTCIVKPAGILVNIDEHVFLYNGQPHCPKITYTFKSNSGETIEFEEGKDYTVKYENNIGYKDKPSTGKIIVTISNKTISFDETEEYKFTILAHECDKWKDGEWTSEHMGDWVSDSLNPPTCTESGTEVRICTACGTKETRTVKALDHNYIKTSVAPTCGEFGGTLYTCSRCGDSNFIPDCDQPPTRENHVYEWQTIKEPTCTNSGYAFHVCKVCGWEESETPTGGKVIKKTLPAKGHTFTQWTDVKKATCTTDGTQTRKCTVCGYTETRTVKATGHDYQKTVVKPTCTSDGYTIYTCSKCNNSYKSDIKKATGHNYACTITKPVTCTENGLYTYKCANCGDTYTKTISATGHKYSTEWTIDVPATTTSEGSKSHHCIYCNDKKDITVIPIAVHNHKYNTKITKSATCTENGIRTYTCSCGDTYTEIIPAVGHKYGEWKITKSPSCTEVGIRKKTCTICGNTVSEFIDKTEHKYKTITVEPTYDTEGYDLHKCSVCEDTYKDNIIPALIKDEENPKNNTDVPASVNTIHTAISSNTVKVEWKAVKGADGYYIYKVDPNTHSYELYDKTNKTTCEFKNLLNGCTYYYAIKAYNNAGISENYLDVTFTAKLSKVTGLKASTEKDYTKLSWKKVYGAKGYYIYQNNKKIKTTSSNTLTVKKLKPGSTYKFSVIAYDVHNSKSSSTSINVYTKPSTVTGVKTKSYNHSIKLSWKKTSGASGYIVYRYNTKTKKYYKIAKTKSTSYTNSKLSSGTSYKYAVRAYRNVNNKELLASKYATISSSTNPDTVNFKLSSGYRKATVKWNKVRGATSYRIYYKTSSRGKWKTLKTVNNKTTKYTKTKLSRRKTYYFTVKAIRHTGGKYYNGGYKTKRITVR